MLLFWNLSQAHNCRQLELNYFLPSDSKYLSEEVLLKSISQPHPLTSSIFILWLQYQRVLKLKFQRNGHHPCHENKQMPNWCWDIPRKWNSSSSQGPSSFSHVSIRATVWYLTKQQRSNSPDSINVLLIKHLRFFLTILWHKVREPIWFWDKFEKACRYLLQLNIKFFLSSSLKKMENNAFKGE